MIDVDLKARKKVLEDEFNQLNNEKDKLVEQGKVMNRRLSEIQARQLELRGSYQEVSTMLGEESVEWEIVSDEEPKKSKKK